jgi:hypothetical protein
MAKFSQEFLRQMASPMGSVQGGLLSGVGGAVTLSQQLKQQQEQKEQMQKFRGMGAVERADYMAQKAQTPQQLMAAESARGKAVKEGSLESLRGLEVARQAAKTTQEKKEIEQIMSRVAVQAGIDPSSVIGRTQEELDKELSRELQQSRLEDQKRAEQEAAITQAYYAVPEKSREQFEKTAVQAGFGNIIDELKEDKARDQLVELQLSNAQTLAAENAAMRKEPLPIIALEDRINNANIDKELKDQLLSELADVKQPDFNNNGTWNPGERKLAMDSIRSINKAVREEVSREVTRKNALRSDIRSLEKKLTSPPTEQEIKAQIPQAEENVVTRGGFFGLTVEDDKEEVKKEAISLARIARDNQIRALIDQRREELGEKPVETEEEVEETPTEDDNDNLNKADSIVGV